MGKRYGMSVTDDGMIIEAAVRISGSTAKLIKVRRWSSHSFIRNYFLLSRTASLGLPSCWVKTIPPASDGLVTAGAAPGFLACANRMEYDHFTELLGNNISARYADDTFLATIPLHFAKPAADTFISLASIDNTLKIGVVIRRVLYAVFKVRITTKNELEGFVGRIERSLRSNDPELAHFNTFYLLTTNFPADLEPDGAIRISCGSDDPAVMKAIGCALPSVELVAPCFDGNNPAIGKLRHLRTAIVLGAALVLAAAGLSALVMFGYTTHYNYRIDQAKSQYHHLFSNNAELRSLISEGDSLSRKLIDVNRRRSKPTRWAPFLELLGTVKPQGLFLERLGSEPVDSAGSLVRTALAGWCETETTATEFIKALKKSQLIEGATLSSIDRISEQNTTCRFKVVCVLKISDR
jgi:hypothetical protein